MVGGIKRVRLRIEVVTYRKPRIGAQLAGKLGRVASRTSIANRLQHTMKLGEGLVLATLACLLLAGSINAKIYTKCELAKQLTANGISRTYQGHWICLANAVSGLDSTKTTELPNQTHNYGIFQINSKEWCRVGYKGGKCNVKCEDLATDSITTAIQCSKLIQQQKGFNEWQLWQKKCKGKDLPDLSNCNAVG